ncbi:DNA helicase, partial [Gluconobacter japonicus]
GRFAIFFPTLLRPRPLGLMTLLTQLRLGESLTIPAPGRVSLPWDLVAGVPGWLQAGQTGIRLDIAERSIAELEHLTRKQDHPAPAGLASRFGVKTDMVPGILTALGIAHRPPSAASPSHAGPPAPLMILSDRRTRAGRRRPKASGQRTSRPTAVRQDSPFAALAILRERSTP